MATTFLNEKVDPIQREQRDVRTAAEKEPGLLDMLSLSSWRKLTLETLAILAAIAAFKHLLPRVAEIPGLPHPYWLPVLLASSQYGIVGGTVATLAASLVYVLEAPQASPVQDFYSYVGTMALHPALWLGTALVVGGLRTLHIQHADALAERLTLGQRREIDLAAGLERALNEIKSLEQRIASDATTVAAFTRGLSRITIKDRATAAASLGELFRTGAGASDFTIYLRTNGSYLPVVAVENDLDRPVTSIVPLTHAAIKTLGSDRARTDDEAAGTDQELVSSRVALVSSDDPERPLAVIIYKLSPGRHDEEKLRRRIGELCSAFSVILSACQRQRV
jgi:hypothetical protein